MITYRQPFSGEYGISQRFGETDTDPNGHTGIDYLTPLGTRILASADGQVGFADFDTTGYGFLVILTHADGRKTYYAHLSFISVKPWEKVTQGQLIGYSGTTGNSTGPHLHFEVRGPDNKPIDPMTVLMTIDDSIGQPVAVPDPVQPAPAQLKDPSALGELVEVVCPDGAKVFNPDWSMKYYGFPQGTKLHFTGRTAERPGFPQFTYCEVYEEPRKYFVAVHDNSTQILDDQKQ